MILYVVRHGEAETRAASDELRELTARGRQSVSELWCQLEAEGVRPAMLAVSPYVRAQQTADEIESYYPSIARQTCGCITPDDDPRRVLAWLSEQPVTDGWVLVSHMPLVAVLTGMLTGADYGRVPFGTGTVACLDMEVLAPEGGRLIWQRHAT